MEIFVECSGSGKVLVPINVAVRMDVLIADEDRDTVKQQALDVILTQSEEMVNKYIPGKFCKGGKYIFVFMYSIIEKFNCETGVWDPAQANINLVEVKSNQNEPLLEIAKG